MAAIADHATVAVQPANDHPHTSPKPSHRATRTGSPPWAKVVIGESEPTVDVTERNAAAAPSFEEESGECGGSGNANAGRRQAWNKPSNGAADIEPVMGAHSWPALSESGKVSSRSSSDSLKSSSDGSPSSSVSIPQGIGGESFSLQKQVSDSNAQPTSTPNHTLTTRQRSMKRNGAASSTNGPPAHSPLVEASSNNRHPSSRDHTQRSGFHGSNDHPQQRNSFRNRSGGPHRGDNSHYRNYGGRHNQEWNGSGSFNGRDAHLQTQRVVPGFIRHPQQQPPPPPPPPPIPPISMPFIAAPTMRPFGAPAYSDIGPFFYFAPTAESLRGMPLVTPMSPIYPQPPELQPHARIVSQIDYYFSNDNLIKDVFLRQNMDDQGWVSIGLIAGFKKVSQLTDNVQLILDALRSSTVVEVQGEKVRKRNDWKRWVIRPSMTMPNASSPLLQESYGQDILAKGVQNMSLMDQKTTNPNQPQLPSSAGPDKYRSVSSV